MSVETEARRIVEILETVLTGVAFRKEGTGATQEGAQPRNDLSQHPGTRSVDDGRWPETVTQTERGDSSQLRHEDRAPGAGQRAQALERPRQFVTPHGCIYLYPSHIAGVGAEYVTISSDVKVRTLFLAGCIQVTVLDSPETMRALRM